MHPKRIRRIRAPRFDASDPCFVPPCTHILGLGPERALRIAGWTQIGESAKIDLPNLPDLAKIDWSRVENVIVAEITQLIPRQDPPLFFPWG